MSEKRARIIATALKLFCEKGFQNTSTATISKEAGVATGTLFLYFKSKDELINALYREAKNELAGFFQQDFPTEPSVENKLYHFWQKAISWALENPYQFRFFNMYSHSPFISSLTKEESASAFQFTLDFVEEAIEAGSLAPIDSGLFIALFSGQLNATVGFLTQNPQLTNRKAVTDQTFALFWKGISKS
ncbi:TetR/AcrR family transcriptional regulator [Adhaeribacter sp. BT258]|uniref:TetR/AcrR family transcriptional regulator n=1 Tax=Adhaeribacter terrigena TaxID=2793070 RepID=A0ABS1BWV9_9BACT|nr:TetR/AcrR family transcriptional regulator [Adhaeribacter terrigena]MBK0401534.1 TetR/AcrR family transcriptional regulator [Adhaeribacter terrigena]